MLAGKSQGEIAATMSKDAAWVSRTVKLIRSDFSTVFVRPEARKMIDEHLAQLESLFRKAFQTVEDATGMAKAPAIRAALEVFTRRAEYQRSIGLLPDEEKLRQENDEGEMISLRELQQNVSQATLDTILRRYAREVFAPESCKVSTPENPIAVALHPKPESERKPRVFGHRRVGN